MWPDCSPPSVPALPAKRLEDVAVADRRRQDADPVLLHEPVEAEVRHLRDGDEVDAEVKGDDGNDLVAVQLLPARVHGEHAVSIAVERHTEIELAAPHGLREQA